MLSPALVTLLDEARAEAKRAGHTTATPLHLAATLARRAPEAFDAAFGEGATTAIRARLLGSPAAGTEDETIALLQSAASADPAAVIAELKRSLGELVTSAQPPLPRQDPAATEVSSLNQPSAPSASQQEKAPITPPQATPAPPGGRLLVPVHPDAAIQGWSELIDELLALLSMRNPATPLLHGPSGCGKSSVPVALAARIMDPEYSGPLAGTTVTRLDTTTALSEDPIAALHRALDAQQPSEIVVVDDLESLLSLGSAATILPMLVRLRGAASDSDRRVMLLMDETYISRLEAIDQELIDATTSIEIPMLPLELLWEIAGRQANALAEHHGVDIPALIARLAASPRAGSDRRGHPGLLADRLDHACARAAMRADRKVSEADLGLAASPEVAPLDAAVLVERLRERVRGQDEVLRPVAARLALARAELDLRPNRPDGVFLFVGPTGVGKTELARALCEQLYGDEERLVRLDMSEYAESWAISRLVGPQPGYVGFTEPEAWLTTRIRKQPDTVLLLDEIEKAHPAVWNAFLQVFDAGRLSDARGNVANFEHTVIAMTSNLGSDAFRKTPIGFAESENGDAASVRTRERILESVKQVMAPELINRLDEIVVFQALSREAIAEIARLEIERMRERLAERGYVITIGDGVVELVADTGYDPAYGARHLQRNVERLLLEPLASISARDVTAEVVDGQVAWRPSSTTSKTLIEK